MQYGIDLSCKLHELLMPDLCTNMKEPNDDGQNVDLYTRTQYGMEQDITNI